MSHAESVFLSVFVHFCQYNANLGLLKQIILDTGLQFAWKKIFRAGKTSLFLKSMVSREKYSRALLF